VNAALNYDSLRETLTRRGFAGALSELHGSVCGVLCSGDELAAQRWLADCVAEEAPDADRETADELRATLSEIALATLAMLSSDELAFEPLLPDDDEPFEAQVEALASYCNGFLSGLAFGGANAAASAADELDEILVDFSEIGRAGVTAEDGEELDRADFALAELKEYVRVGVQLVYEQVAARGGAPRGAVQ
jgi:yecA family protein